MRVVLWAVASWLALGCGSQKPAAPPSLPDAAPAPAVPVAPSPAKDAAAASAEAPVAGPTGSLDAMIGAGMGALAQGQVEVFQGLLGTAEELRSTCPELVAEIAKDGKAEALDAWIASERKGVSERVTACHQLFNWQEAKEVRREGGHVSQTPDKKCPRVQPVSDVEVCMAAGDLHYRVRFNSVFLRDKVRFGLGRGPTCRETPGDEPPCKAREGGGGH